MDGIDYLIREYEATGRSLTWAPFFFYTYIYLLHMEIPARYESLVVQ